MATRPYIVFKYLPMGLINTEVASYKMVMHLTHQVHSQLSWDIESRTSFPTLWYSIKPGGCLFIFGFSINLGSKLSINNYMSGIWKHDDELQCTLLAQKLILMGESISPDVDGPWFENDLE